MSFPILAIETSCDETSAAVVDGRDVRANIVASQIEMHQKWGGVVPEAAARAHVDAILPVVTEALEVAGRSMPDIRGLAVTNRPGLVGALSVGVTFAKMLAARHQLPIVGIHHLEGHLSSVLALEDEIKFPHLSLIVSGGHSELVLVKKWGGYEILGETRDDAAGEALDKGARLLGLGYPGGRAIQELARSGDPRRYSLPRSSFHDSLQMSFSGVKTAMLRLVQTEGDQIDRASAAASLQEAVVDALIKVLERAIGEYDVRAVSIVGGVSANERLRARAIDLCARFALPCMIPPLALCTDNAAMIGLAAAIRFARGESHPIEVLEASASEDLVRSL